MRELGTIEFAYTLGKDASMKETFEYYRLLNKYIHERLTFMGLPPSGVRLDKVGVVDGMIRYTLTERHV